MVTTIKSERLKTIFPLSGLTQEQIVQESGVGRNTVHRAVHGKCVRRDLLVKIIKAFQSLVEDTLEMKISLADDVSVCRGDE